MSKRYITATDKWEISEKAKASRKEALEKFPRCTKCAVGRICQGPRYYIDLDKLYYQCDVCGFFVLTETFGQWQKRNAS